jgi:hypothetical protein
MTMRLSTRRWQDQAILLLGAWLFASPWALGIGAATPAAINAFTTGVVMAALAAIDLVRTHVWAVVLNLLVGLWVAISPWMVEALQVPAMATNLLVVGVATIVLALWELRSDPDLHEQWISTGTAS